jgi:uncharacterized membrane protein YfcA
VSAPELLHPSAAWPAWYVAALFALAILAGATAAVVGFGIGSLLTPLLAARFGTDIAVACVALPHLLGGLVRGWRLRHAVDRAVLVRFGVLSAAGGLAGALLFSRLAPAALTRILGALLLLTASAGVTGWTERWTPRGPQVWGLGLLSGFFGGVVGNQGGLRAAALSVFRLTPAAFVATSTVVGVLVDLARAPVYLYHAGTRLLSLWEPIAIAALGVLIGTLMGERLLLGLSRARFRLVVSLAIGALGLWFLLAPA